jgi:autophagy-related protein 9
MGRAYRGYSQVLEENEEEEQEEYDLEAGPSQPSPSGTGISDSKRRVSWQQRGASHSHAPLRPNIQSEDARHDQDSSDDEVPQDLMVETSMAKSKRPSKTATTNSSSSPGQQRHQPLRTPTSTRRHGPVVLPPSAVAAGESSSAPLSVPPRPSEIDVDETPARVSSTQERQSRPMGALDAYDRAMWNWVNVYNLDAFLQEVYYYYEGKGIYSIALTRGLNLLSVSIVNIVISISHLTALISTVGFVIGFSTFLLGCVDYSRIRPEGSTQLSDVVVSRCVSRYSTRISHKYTY